MVQKRIKNLIIKSLKISNFLFFYTIDNAIKNKLFNKYISTDSNLIKKIVKKKLQIEFLKFEKLSDDFIYISL